MSGHMLSLHMKEKILKEFKEVYDVRSRIIHRGKAKLSLRERYLFWKLQWMCRRVIQKEVELFQEDIRRISNKINWHV